jgi:hypothetical protein
MQSKIIKYFVYLFLLLIVLTGIVASYLYYLSNRIPNGELTHVYLSPNKLYMINIYLIEGTLSEDAVKGEFVKKQTGEKTTVYFNYPDENPYVKWIDNKHVIIGDKLLNVIIGDTYNYNKDKKIHTSADDLPRQANN